MEEQDEVEEAPDGGPYGREEGEAHAVAVGEAAVVVVGVVLCHEPRGDCELGSERG